MATIQDYLKQIVSAVYGKEVRSAIYNAIQQCYLDGRAGSTDLDARQKIDVLASRVNNLTANTGESTENNAELIDIRVGEDGITYDTAGEAVRGQFESVKELIANVEKQAAGAGIIQKREYALPDTEAGTIYILNDSESSISNGSMNKSGTVGLASNTRYKYAQIPYNNGMTVYSRVYTSAIAEYPPVIVYDNGSYLVPEYSQTSVEGTAVNYMATVYGYSANAVVYVNMYDSAGTFTSTGDYYYTTVASSGNTLELPAFNDEFVPTIDDEKEYEYKTFSSKKIAALTGMKAKYPTNGVEHFTIIINKHIQNDNSNTENVQDGVTEYEDAGVIFIPQNYSETGTPTRLIISCHGSGTVIDDSFSLTSKTWNNFFVKMGYAVMDVNGGVEDSRHFGSPFAIQSYIKAYQYVIEKYNLYPEVFVLGGSMGGLPAFTLSQCGFIPVIALAGFCPVVDLYRQAWCKPWYGGSNGSTYSEQRKRIAEYFNFDGYESFSGWTSAQTPSSAEKQYFLDNLNKVAGYNPMTAGAVNANGSGIYDTNNSEYEAAYQSLIKLQKVPLKIWQSEADPTVPADFGKYLVQAVKNAGGIAEHRSYPSGGHTPGWGNNVIVQDVSGNSIEAYSNEYECYLWFKRFEFM